VDWLCDGSQMTPIVLCPVIVDQCKILLSDNYTRALFQNALVHASVDTDQILLMKDKHDLEMEKDMAEIRLSSASSLASKDATTADRSKTLIVTSEWAKKVTRGVVSFALKYSICFQWRRQTFTAHYLDVVVQIWRWDQARSWNKNCRRGKSPGYIVSVTAMCHGNGFLIHVFSFIFNREGFRSLLRNRSQTRLVICNMSSI
jgi:hypothetical protein